MANLVLTVPLAFLAAGWNWPLPAAWLHRLDLNAEGSAANLYSGILWGIVAALAAAQLLRPVIAMRGPQWLWPLGWLGAALFAALVAFEEIVGLKNTLARSEWLAELLATLNLSDLPLQVRWAVVIAPLAAPLAAAAGWALYASLRRRPALALLTVLALALGVSAVLHDGFTDHYGSTSPWVLLLDDGAEHMAGAILAVVLVEALAARLTPGADDRDHRGRRHARWAALGLLAALLGVTAPALLAEYEWEDSGWTRPLFYAGPIYQLKQPFQANLDWLSRIDVWGHAAGRDGANATAEIQVRLIPHEGGPETWGQAEVRGHHSYPVITVINFDPIPDSKGKRYDLVILSEPFPYVHLGLTGNDSSPLGGVVVNGVEHERQLAMSAYTRATGGRVILDLLTRDPRRLFVIGEVVAMLFLWVFAVMAAWRGLSGPKPRFWRGFVWSAARPSAFVTVGLLVIALAIMALPRIFVG